FTFSKFIFTYFLSDPFRRFPAFFNTFTPSFAGCKGITFFAFCEIYFKLFSSFKCYFLVSENVPLSLFAGCKGTHEF
ncbi:hypothetical protein, partial [Mucilaginibacter boryungensis]